MPSSAACAGCSIRFWFNAFSTITVTAFSGPAILGSNWVPPQPGRMPRKHSGSAIMAALAASVR